MIAQGDDKDNNESLLKLALSLAGENGEVSYDIKDENSVLNHKNQKTITEDNVADVFSQQMPANASDPQNVDSLIASQMSRLSVDDREKVYMDVHGISDDVKESLEMVEHSLVGLQHEIDLLPDKRAYNMASQLHFNYVQDRDFRLAFLRCEKFDCQKAALRIIRHFQMKLDLFGMDKLTMDIVQDDLDAEAMDALYGSFGRFLNAFDSGGRIINCIFAVPKLYKTDAVLRQGFYNIMTAFRNANIQRRGGVTVYLAFGDIEQIAVKNNSDRDWKYPKLNQGTPMRVSAFHLCYNDEVVKENFAVSGTSFNKDLKVRTRFFHGMFSSETDSFISTPPFSNPGFSSSFHLGTVQECLQYLRGHGIDPACIPVNSEGEMTDKLQHCRRLEDQRKYERLNNPPRSTIHVPFSQDVILGKGCPFQNHPGNKRVRELVDCFAKRYDKAERGDKKEIAQEIVDAIKQSGGYFLKQDGKQWIRVDNKVARKKVSATFRTQRWIAKS
ncbi:MAG: hypothetical protein SGBAC_004580 [Bacillariaceae sp.]